MNKAVLIVVMSVICANVIMAGPHKPKHAPRPHTPPPRHHVPHNPPKHHAPKHHHHHHKGSGAAVAAGVIGGAIVGAAIAESLRPDPVVVAPAPVVVQQPVVVAQPVTQVQKVWIEGRYVEKRDANGMVIQVWEPGHYEQRTVTISSP